MRKSTCSPWSDPLQSGRFQSACRHNFALGPYQHHMETVAFCALVGGIRQRSVVTHVKSASMSSYYKFHRNKQNICEKASAFVWRGQNKQHMLSNIWHNTQRISVLTSGNFLIVTPKGQCGTCCKYGSTCINITQYFLIHMAKIISDKEETDFLFTHTKAKSMVAPVILYQFVIQILLAKCSFAFSLLD